MKGQWTGKYTGTNCGALLVNLDEVKKDYSDDVYHSLKSEVTLN